jgi:dihydrofolate reductase
MKTILIFVVTADGKVTKWGDPMVRLWSSKEDQVYFSALMKDYPLVIIGSSTYNADPIPPRSGRLLVVMTRNPAKYRDQEIAGQRIFLGNTPSELVDFYRGQGYHQMLIVGGPKIATAFLKENLIDEIWLTIEPKIFGSGGSFVVDDQLDINLRLINSTTINGKGTVIHKYAVI